MTTQVKDVVDLLQDQHAHIRDLFEHAARARKHATRVEAFEQLRRFLAVHETAEELVTHPVARMADGNDVVDARLEEEDAMKRLLAQLDHLDVDDAEFGKLLSQLRTAVLRHMELEEREEFPLLRAGTDPHRLERMATALRAVEAIAPTHAHPRAGSSMTANLMVGPLASVLDRTRDAVRSALRER
jgi:hemerythrin superfamily protein